jgi:hypothetical protein
MNNKPLEQNPNQAVNDAAELVLSADEIDQLAKFLDALLEADIANRTSGGNVND